MDNSQKTTAFSAHLSWAAMRRFLQERISSEESQRVEMHLKHCPRCSSAIVDYIQTEEPHNQKQYMKKLKGNLKSSQATKKRIFSAFQLKAIRTTAAVIVLLVFSFFAFKTIIGQQDTRRPLPSESLAVMKKKPKTTTADRKKVDKATKQSEATLASPKAAEQPKAVEKKSAPKKVEKKNTEPVKEAAPAPEQKKIQPKASSVSTTEAAKKIEEAPEEQRESAPAPVATPETTPSSPEVNKEATAEEEVKEVTRAEPIPTLKKQSSTQLNTSTSIKPVAPLGNKQPAAIPVPSNQIRER